MLEPEKAEKTDISAAPVLLVSAAIAAISPGVALAVLCMLLHCALHSGCQAGSVMQCSSGVAFGV